VNINNLIVTEKETQMSILSKMKTISLPKWLSSVGLVLALLLLSLSVATSAAGTGETFTLLPNLFHRTSASGL
jgi:hypothetical protein